MTLDPAAVPKFPGLYVAVRTPVEKPLFLETSAGGRFKGGDPSIPVS